MNILKYKSAQRGCIKFINSVGEEYQVVKKGREYHGCREENNMEKGKGEAISSSLKY